METKILEQKENPVVGRKEIMFEIVYEQRPPTRADAKQVVASNAGTKEEFTVIKRMNNVFGLRKLIGLAHAYETEEAMNKFETKNIIKRNQVKKEGAQEKKEGEA